MSKGSGTRSGLLWEVERILDECEELPQVLLMENVPQVIGKKNIADFQKWRSKLEALGYSNYVQLLNAKDYGIPQNRNRCFMVSILGEYYYEFPKKIPLTLKLKDMLEDKVDEKYYLSDQVVQSFIRYNERQKEMGNTFKFDPLERERESEDDQARRLKSEVGRQLHNRVGYLDRGTGEHQSNTVYSTDGVARTIQGELETKSPLKILECP